MFRVLYIPLLGMLFWTYKIRIAIFVALLVFYLTGFVYISLLWHLASIVPVLENMYGIKAMIKSKALL